MVARVRLAVRVRVVSVVRVPVAPEVLAVRVPAVDPEALVVRAPVVDLVVRVAVRVPRVAVEPRVVAVAVVVRKSCSPVRFVTPNPRHRFPKASSSSSAVCRHRSSRRV